MKKTFKFNVLLNQTYKKAIIIKNNGREAHSITLEPSNTSRYQISPMKFQLNPQMEQEVEIKLCIQDSPNRVQLDDEIIVTTNSGQLKIEITCVIKSTDQQNTSYRAESFKYRASEQRSFAGEGSMLTFGDVEFYRTRKSYAEEENNLLHKKLKDYETQVQELQEMLQVQKAEANAHTNTSVQQSEAMLKNLSVELEAEKQKKEELLKKTVAKAQADEFYQEMIKLIRSHSPDIEKVVELALKQERLQAERKDQHILTKFQEKDSQIMALRNHNAQLEHEVAELQSVLVQQKEILSYYENNNRSESEKIAELAQLIEQQKQEIFRINEENFALKAVIPNLEADFKRKQEECHKYQDKIDSLEQEIYTLNKTKATLSQEIEDWKKENLALNFKINECSAREEQLRELHMTQMNLQASGQATIQTKDKLISELQEKISQQTTSIENLLKQLNQAEADKRTELDQLHSLQEENSQLKKDINDLKKELSELRSSQSGRECESSEPMNADDLRTSTNGESNKQHEAIRKLEQQVSSLTASLNQAREALEIQQRHKQSTTRKENHSRAYSPYMNAMDENDLFETCDRIQVRNIFAKDDGRTVLLERELQKEMEEKNRLKGELNLLSKRLEAGFHYDASLSVSNDHLISKLNARVSQLKHREQKLMDENMKLEEQCKYLQRENDHLRHQTLPEKLNLQAKNPIFIRDYQPNSYSSSGLNSDGSFTSPDNLREMLSPADIETVKREVQSLQTAKTKLESEFAATVTKANTLQENLEKASLEKKEMSLQIAELQKEIVRLENALESQAQLHAEKSSFERFRRELQDQQRELNEEKKTLQAEFEAYKQDYSSMTGVLKAEIESLRADNKRYEEEIQEMQRNYLKEASRFAETADLLTAKTNELKEANEKIHKLVKEKDGLVDQLNYLREDAASARKEAENTKEVADKAQTQLMSQLNSAKESLERAKTQREEELKNSRAGSDELIKLQARTIADLEIHKKTIELRNTDLLNELEKAEEKWNLKEKEYKRQIEELREEVMRMPVCEVEKRHGYVSNALSPKSLDSDSRIINSYGARSELNRSAEKDKRAVEIAQLRSTIEVLQGRINDYEKELDSLYRQRDELAHLNEALREKLEEFHGAYVPKNEKNSNPKELDDVKVRLSVLLQQSSKHEKNSKSQWDSAERFKSKGSRHTENLETQLIELVRQNEMLSREKAELKSLLESREEQLERALQEIEELKRDTFDGAETRDTLKKKLNFTESKRDRVESEALLLKYREELEKSNAVISLLNEEMKAALDQSDEIQKVLLKQIDLIQDKFSKDVKELVKKVNKSLTLDSKQKFDLDETLQRYANFYIDYSQKEATISILKQKLANCMKEKQSLMKNISALESNSEEPTKTLSRKSSWGQLSRSSNVFKNTADMLPPRNSHSDQTKALEPLIKNQTQQIDLYEAKVVRLERENQQLQLNVDQLKQVNAMLDRAVFDEKARNQDLERDISKLIGDLNGQQKHKRVEMSQTFGNFEAQRAKWIAPEIHQKALDDIQELESSLKSVKEELQHKKEQLQLLKQERDNKKDRTDELKLEISQLKEEIANLQQLQQEAAGKETNYKEFKERYDTLKITIKQLQDERDELLDNIRGLKSDLCRREGLIADLKTRVDKSKTAVEHKESQDALLERQRKEIRLLEQELQEKDVQFKSLKSKLDAVLIEVDQLRHETLQSNTQELNKEARHQEQLKAQIKKLEATVQNIAFLLRRLYRDTLIENEKMRTKFKTISSRSDGIDSLSRYMESSSVLNIAPEEAYTFLDPKNKNAKHGLKASDQRTLLDKFEDRLKHLDAIDPSELYETIKRAIDERVLLSKSIN